MLDITLSIVSYNNSENIEKTVNGIMNNIPNCLKYKFYIIDNCSADGTREKLARLKGPIEVIPLYENIGFGRGHNIALRRADS